MKQFVFLLLIVMSNTAHSELRAYQFNNHKNYQYFLSHLWYTERQFKNTFNVRVDSSNKNIIYVIGDPKEILSKSWLVYYRLKESSDKIWRLE